MLLYLGTRDNRRKFPSNGRVNMEPNTRVTQVYRLHLEKNWVESFTSLNETYYYDAMVHFLCVVKDVNFFLKLVHMMFFCEIENCDQLDYSTFNI